MKEPKEQFKMIPFRPTPRTRKLIEISAKIAKMPLNQFLEKIAARYHKEILADIAKEQAKEDAMRYKELAEFEKKDA